MNEKTKADLNAFRHERSKQWTLSDDPETIIEPIEDEPDWIYQDCPHCGQSNTPMGLLGKLNHFNCRACGWWYT